MVTVFFCRKTQEAFVVDDIELFRDEIFRSGLRNEADFEMARTDGIVQIKPMGSSLNVSTIDLGGKLVL
jgi:hypothetical protein